MNKNNSAVSRLTEKRLSHLAACSRKNPEIEFINIVKNDLENREISVYFEYAIYGDDYEELSGDIIEFVIFILFFFT